MKILIATPLYPPDEGGPATYSKILNDELPKHGIGTRVFSFGEVRHLPTGISHAYYFFKLLKGMKEADVTLSLDPLGVGLPVCLAAFFLRKQFILRVAGDRAWETYQMQNAKCKSQNDNSKFVSLEEFQKRAVGPMILLRKKIQSSVAKRAARVIVPSEYLKKIIILWGVPRENISVIYNSFDPVHIPEDKKEIRSLFGIEGTVILSAGRLVPWKGFAALIDIMPDILKEFPDAKLYIAGDGPDRGALRLQIANYKLQTHIVFLGALPRETLLRYVKAADIFALNTGYEGFSHQLLEVMSVGTPIVSTDICGNPELIENGKEGVLVSFNNKAELTGAILGVLRWQIDTGALTREAKQKALQFSKERMITETMNILL